MPRNIPDERTP